MADLRRRKRDGVSPETTHKRCLNCRVVKPISEFYGRSDHSGTKPQCKPCYNAIVARTKNPEIKRAWIHKNREKLNKQNRSNYRLRRATLKGWLTSNLSTRRQQCKTEDIEFTITVADVLEIYDTQGGLCALTGRELKWGLDSNRGPDTLSIDRIDAVGPYVRSNVRLVTHWSNVARQRFTDEEFVAMCRTVVNLADKPVIALMIATPKGQA
jgi:hypothetical protein